MILENHGVVMGGGSLREALRAVQDPGIRRQDGHQGEPAGPGAVSRRGTGRTLGTAGHI
ncbi:MAG: hypothetical protein U0794_20935 [Isosphaeraceae bacterium]